MNENRLSIGYVTLRLRNIPLTLLYGGRGGETPSILYLRTRCSWAIRLLIADTYWTESWVGFKVGLDAVKFSLCLTHYGLRHEGVWGSGCIDPHFLDLSTSWRWVVSFTPLPLFPRRKSPWYPLDKNLGWSQSRSGRRGEKKIVDTTGTRIPTPPSSSS
jgi:hypothetical protein